MNCKICSGLLIEYLEDQLSAEDAGSVKDHLKSCAECSLELEHYKEIRMAARQEAVPEVSAHVLSSLSKAARKNVSPKKVPFWKKWSYTPILVPTISAAFALSVWFYYGDTGFENVEMTSREAASVKMEPLNDRAELYEGSEEDEMAHIEKLQNKEATLDTAVTEELEHEKPSADSRISAAPSPEESAVAKTAPKKSMLEQRDTTEEDKVTYRKSLSPSDDAKQMQESFDDESSGSQLQAVQPAMPDYGSSLGLAQRQQAEGDCGASIETNNALLNSSPPPPGNIQAASYKSLAECYEKKGDTKNAVSSYNRLAEIDPTQADMVNQKLAELNVEPAKMNIKSSNKAKEPAN